MKYFLYIDESGSLNKMNIKNSIFSITVSLFKDENRSEIRGFFRHELNNLKSKMNVEKREELKASEFKQNDMMEDLFRFVGELRYKYVDDYCAYIANKGIDPKWLEDKNITYNFMVKQIIKQIICNIRFDAKKDDLFIVVDNRTVGKGSLNSLEEYLKSSFLLEKKLFRSIKCAYEDSHKNWGIQLADFFSYINYHEIRNKVNIEKKRKIY